MLTDHDGGPDRIDVGVAPGIRLRVLDWGGPGPAVVLLHPNGFCAGLYQPIADRLRQFARPIAIDLPGHGASTAPTGADSYAFEQLAADVVAVLDALGLHGVIGVGGSLGGAVAVLVDRLDPGRWSRLLLAEPVAFPISGESAPAEAENLMVAGARRRRDRFPDRAAVIRAYRDRPPLSQLAPEALEAYVRWGTVEDGDGVRLACAPEVEAKVFEVSAGPAGAAAAWEHLPQLCAPTTILAGADTFLPDVFGEQATRAGAELVTVSGGHFVLHESTVRGVELIERYALG
ncbi:alpha/beta fold hydrolase [Actinomarinicola tropica]|uniref:Alpha/beta fold hydrolase n=1 Tax=Actinomarinicola tropica TaxID=2789776 RepID=A0A5Q2RGU4_9ACTN|nr:alpha/beta hydrolase [Actinomarinicola tropica]QGG94052.1 alpha/beta fold hydrolase [Actinomarinicola tropica]